MKRFIFWLICLIVAVWIGLHIKHNPSYVLITFPHYVVEMPLWAAILVAIVGFTVLYYFFRFLYFIINSPSHLRSWWSVRKQKKAEQNVRNAFLHLARAEWQSAESCLLKAKNNNVEPFLNYLALAYAVQAQGKVDQRDDYLHQAYEVAPHEALAIGLTQAQMQLWQGQHEQALATLQKLHRQYAKHPYIVYLLYKTYSHLQDWQSLAAIFPVMQKLSVISPAQLQTIEVEMYQGLFTQATDRASVENIWQGLSRDLQANESLKRHYEQRLASVAV